MTDRAFENPYPDYDGTSVVFDFATHKLPSETENALLKNIFILLENLESRKAQELDWSDTTIYTGITGVALMYMHLMDIEQCQGKGDFLKQAWAYMEQIPPILPIQKKRISFIHGTSGTLAVFSVLFHREGRIKESIDVARSIECLEPDVVKPASDYSDELLFGRVGYLFSLLFLEKHIAEDKFRDHVLKNVVATILESGQRGAYKPKNDQKIPLFYEWYDQAYIGSVHGLAGIMYMFLQAQEYLSKEQIDKYVKPTIDKILDLQFPSGNFPMSLENSADKLVHWCHGAPGVIHLLLLAYQVFRDEKYLKAANACGDIIWQKGLLKKGYGLCHGVAGNGYAHLRLFQVTKDSKHLYRALKFAEWCMDYEKHDCRIPDNPLSLFEGLAGTIYFLADCLNPLNSAFPGFQLF